MTYPGFDPLRPNPASDDGTGTLTVIRTNMLALRDAALSGTLVGWALSVSGGTAAHPTTWTYSSGTERVRIQITWGSGSTAGLPITLAVSYSSNGGGAWTNIGTGTLSYTAQGHFTGATGLSPGLAAHWLMGLPERVRLIESALASYGTMAAQDAASVDITGGTITGLVEPLDIMSGGTGGGTAQAARIALGADNAENVTKGVFDPVRLGTGTPSAEVFLRGDGAWVEVPTGLTFGPRPVSNLGDVATAGSQTVTLNLSENDFFACSMAGADAAGTLAIDFGNMPDTSSSQFAWHLQIVRGGRKPVSFVQTVQWAGGQAPSLSTGVSAIDLLMFYRVLNGPVRGMLVDSSGA